MENESAYLSLQAEQARAAITQTVHEMSGAALQVIDIRRWTQQYPLISLGSAAALGFATALVLTPRQEQTIKQRLAEINEQLSRLAASRGETEPAEARSAFASIGSKLAGMARHAITSSLAASLTAALKGNEESAEVEPPAAGEPAPPPPY